MLISAIAAARCRDVRARYESLAPQLISVACRQANHTLSQIAAGIGSRAASQVTHLIKLRCSVDDITGQAALRRNLQRQAVGALPGDHAACGLQLAVGLALRRHHVAP